jgi:hypothetical protein
LTDIYSITLYFVNFLGIEPKIHPASLKVGHGGTLDHTATGVLGTEPCRTDVAKNEIFLCQ